MKSKVIGIISWLPDDPYVRNVRVQRLNNLMYHCISMFRLPIIIIAQNWRPNEIMVSSNTTVYKYDKLGITGARKELRQKFLESDYDTLIMFDDDFEMLTSVKDVAVYLDAVDKYDIVLYKNFLLNAMAISKDIFKEVDYKDVSAENGEGFEDWILVSMLQNMYPNSVHRVMNVQLSRYERCQMVNDAFSTWINSKTDKDKISMKSQEIINEAISNNHNSNV